MRITSAGGISFGSSGTAYGTAGQKLVSNGDAAPTWGSSVVQATSQNTTSGTSVTFTSIPSWVKRITFMINGVSTSATNTVLGVRLGTGGSLVTTGYKTSYFGYDNTDTAFFANTTSSIATHTQLASAASTLFGTVTITNITGNVWSSTFFLYAGNSVSETATGGGFLSLAGALDRVGLVVLAGTAFDAGSVNILYE